MQINNLGSTDPHSLAKNRHFRIDLYKALQTCTRALQAFVSEGRENFALLYQVIP